MTTKRVLVTGASGFIGRPLVEAFVRAGYAVRAAVRRPASFQDSVEVAVVPDFKDAIDWAPILQGVDIVVHLAGLVHADQRDVTYSDHDRINHVATVQLAEAAKKAAVERFVYVSSVRAQVGPSAANAVRESDEPRPSDHYGRSKLAAERAIQVLDLPYSILRPVVIYGPRPKGNLRTLFRLTSLPLPLPFKGFNSRRSLLGIDNFISAIFFVLNNPATIGETFLIADPTPLALPELLSILGKAKGRAPWLFYFPPALIRLAFRLSGSMQLWKRIGEDLVVDTGKLESFGWRPAIATDQGLRAALSAEHRDRR